MAGRAGRRGKDQFGTCILCLDRAFGFLPKEDEFESILENQGSRLESKLRLSYQFALNVVQSDDLMINDVWLQSFFENENQKERVLALDKSRKLKLKIQKSINYECKCGTIEEMKTLYDIYQRICD